jgi:hypothetical protein
MPKEKATTPKRDPAKLALLWAESCARIVRKAEGNPDAATAENFAGFMDGLRGRVIPHPHPGVPPVRHSMNPSYCEGFELGEAMAKAAKVFAP